MRHHLDIDKEEMSLTKKISRVDRIRKKIMANPYPLLDPLEDNFFCAYWRENEYLLRSFLHAVMAFDQDTIITKVDYLDTKQYAVPLSKEGKVGKTMFPDLLLMVHTIRHGKTGSIIVDLEAQRYIDYKMIARLLGYSTRLYQGQILESLLDYEDASPVHTLLLSSKKIPQFEQYGLGKAYAYSYSMRCNEGAHAIVTDRLRTTIIDKIRFQEALLNSSKIDKLSHGWLFLFFHPVIMLEDRYWDFCEEEEIMADAAEKVYTMSRRDRLINAAREFNNQKFFYDSSMQYAEQKGMMKGIEQGIEQGRVSKQRETIQNLLSLGSDIPFICQVTGLGNNEVVQIIEEIKTSEGK